jgi:glycosyltransferase 2 family protein
MRPPPGAARASPPIESAPQRPRRARTLATVAVGALILVLLVSYTGIGPVVERLHALGWRAPLVLLPYLTINVLDTFGWRRALPPAAAARVPFVGLYLVRMAGEAVNSVTPTAAVGGEPVKAHLLRTWGVAGTQGAASVVIAKTALTLSQITFILVGLAAYIARRNQGAVGGVTIALMILGSLGFALLLVRAQRRQPATTVWRWLHRIAPEAGLVRRLEGKVHEIDARLAEFYRIERRAFLDAYLLHFVAWMLGVVEVQLILTFIGASVPWRDALIIEALAQPIRAVALVIPGGLGAQEVGGVALATLLGVPEAAAVTLWLLKRARELFFDAVGLAYLAHRTARSAPEPVV